MQDYLAGELHQVGEAKKYIDQCETLKESVVQMSSKRGAESNYKDIVQPPETPVGAPMAPPPIRIPGPMSPYHSKINMPDTGSSRGRNRSSQGQSSAK